MMSLVEQFNELNDERENLELDLEMAKDDLGRYMEKRLHSILDDYKTPEGFAVFSNLPGVHTEILQKEIYKEPVGTIDLVENKILSGEETKLYYGYAKGKKWQALIFSSTKYASNFLLLLDDQNLLRIGVSRSYDPGVSYDEKREIMRSVSPEGDVEIFDTANLDHIGSLAYEYIDANVDVYSAFTNSFGYNIEHTLKNVIEMKKEEHQELRNQIEFYKKKDR